MLRNFETNSWMTNPSSFYIGSDTYINVISRLATYGVNRKCVIFWTLHEKKKKCRAKYSVNSHSLWNSLCIRTRSGTWTRTAQRPQDFKSGVSTNSTIRAWKRTKKALIPAPLSVERKTGFEPATSTLARLRSTNWAIFAFGVANVNILELFSRI